MPKRKTIAVEDVRTTINGMLTRPLDCVCKESKATLCCLLEHVLMDTGNYQGFKWNLSHDESVSVRPDDDTYYNRKYF